MNAKFTLLHWLLHNIDGDLNAISKSGLLAHFIFLLCYNIILNLYETENYVSYKHISQLRILLSCSSVIKGYQNYVRIIIVFEIVNNGSIAKCLIVMFLVIININSVIVNFMTQKYLLFVLTGVFLVPI